MLSISETNRFRKDVKLCKKRGLNLKKLDEVVRKLAIEQKLEMKHRLHKLSGNWSGFWDCHIEPDWVLIFEMNEKELILTRTGTHSDLL